jgi:hypothetical protein
VIGWLIRQDVSYSRGNARLAGNGKMSRGTSVRGMMSHHDVLRSSLLCQICIDGTRVGGMKSYHSDMVYLTSIGFSVPELKRTRA